MDALLEALRIPLLIGAVVTLLIFLGMGQLGASPEQSNELLELCGNCATPKEMEDRFGELCTKAGKELTCAELATLGAKRRELQRERELGLDADRDIHA